MINFPNTPTLNQIFTVGALSWKWDSVKWVVSGAGPPTITVVNTTTALPVGTTGFVRVENTTSAPITVTLPTTPTAGQLLTIKDMSGNASTWAITVTATGGILIEGSASVVINFNYGWVDLIYTGVKWGQK